MIREITVLIYTRNEEINITECIKSARLLSDQIIVIDMESNDRTIEIAKKLRANIISFPYLHYVEPARKFGIEKAATDWVFILDADERITPELAAEIGKIINLESRIQNSELAADNLKFAAYCVPRKNIFGKKKWLKHGGWWPDRQIRLINKKHFVDWPKEIHSTPRINGNRGYLKQPLLHYFHGDLASMVDKTLIFEKIESDLLYKADRSATTLTFFRKFSGELFRRLVKQAGFMDGKIGIIESIYQAFSKTVTYLFLYEKKNRRTL